MKKGFSNRAAALLVAVLMCVSLLPAGIFADENNVVKPTETLISFGVNFGAYAGESELEGLYAEGNTITVRYTDGTEKEYLSGTKTRTVDGSDVRIPGFFLKDGGPEDELEFDLDYEKPFVSGNNTLKFRIYAPYTDEDGDKAVTAIDKEYQYYCSTKEPVEVGFEAAEGFMPEGAIGYNCIEESAFYGEGNKFVVKYKETSAEAPEGTEKTVEYLYVKNTDDNGATTEGFYENGSTSLRRLDLSEGFDCDLKKGENHVELKYFAEVRGAEKTVEIPFKVDIRATKYGTYYEWKTYSFTGKAIKPKFIVKRTCDDKVVPASRYTFKAPENNDMGYYDVELTFKDKYKDKYASPVIEASYGIGPAKPKIQKLTAGRKSLTVTWKKFTSAQLKNMDKMYIEVAADKKFSRNCKSYTIKRKDIKKGKAVLKKQKLGKKYYVRIYTYKDTVEQDGEVFSMRSDNSNMKSAKTK